MASFISLYSGSSGNSSVVVSQSGYLIIDMGKSCRTTLTQLKALGLPLSDCLGVLVTHEHSDHIGGLTTFLKHYHPPVYAGAATLSALESKGVLPPAVDAVELQGRSEDIGGFTVTAFPTSHDVPCCGFRIHTPDQKTMAIATDLGCITPAVHQGLAGCDLVALEANYDLDSLRYGPYPYYLKTRIESSHGHLDNRESAAKVLELLQSGCRKVALCHLSQANNSPQLALQTVRQTLSTAGVEPEELPCCIQVQRRSEVSPAMEF